MAHATNDESSAVIRPGVEKAISANGYARVLIKLKSDVSSKKNSLTRGDIRDLHTRFEEALIEEKRTGEFEEKHQMETIPWMSARISRAVLEKLRSNNNVAIIEEDIPIYAQLAESVPQIGADQSWELGITGSGISVAVLDTGIDTDHTDLYDSLVWEECFLSGGSCPVTGTTTASGEGSAEDGNGHGTHVAGIITSDNTTYSGVAPNAGIVAIKILNDSGSGSMSNIVSGLDWVAENHDAYRIRIVNMSLGSETIFEGACDSESASLADAVAAVKNEGIVLFAASGNDGEDSGISIPACLSDVVSVGAVYDSGFSSMSSEACSESNVSADQVVCFSNVSDELDLLAPGAVIVSSKVGGGTTSMSGTSMSTPHAAGMAALLLEANADLTPDQVLALMVNTGVSIYDDRIDAWFPRIDAETSVPVALSDLDTDGDVDGADLAILAADSASADHEVFASVLGSVVY